MMELGATICTPRDPQCRECPLSRYCEANKHGTQLSLPSKKIKPTTERLERTLLIVERGHSVLLTPSARVKGFWDLPELSDSKQVYGIRATERLGSFCHTITHRRYTFEVYKGVSKMLLSRTAAAKPYRWVAHPKLHEIPLSTTAKKALRCLGM